MVDMAQEEQLSRLWLNTRARYDEKARCENLLSKALEQIRHLEHPIVVDLGAGTGNNTLYLLEHLMHPGKLVLVEQHDYLLQEARKRIKAMASLAHGWAYVEKRQNCDVLKTPQSSEDIELQFCSENIFHLLEELPHVDILSCAALLDLFSVAELETLYSHVEKSGCSLLATLNYTGAVFHPKDPYDGFVLQRFEEHMSRSLDKGNPKGKHAVEQLESLVGRCEHLEMLRSPSLWRIPAEDSEFLLMNLEFYINGALAVTVDLSEKDRIDSWARNKKKLIAESGVSLIVSHEDCLIRPISIESSCSE